MKVLVIGDIHGRKFWRESIKNIDKVDKVVFLGDYLDPYPNEFKENPDSMEMTDFHSDHSKLLIDILSLKDTYKDKIILLTGNHTDSYIWNNFSAASRTDHINYTIYHNLFLDDLDNFNIVWIEDNVIFSHAGITKGWAEDFLYSFMKYDEGAELENNSLVFEAARVLKDTPLKNFNRHYVDAISHISKYRGGNSIYGSCEWADLMEHIDHYATEVKEEIVPLGEDKIYQVFGHTQLKRPLITKKWACLDCRKGFIIDTLTYEINEC